MKGAMQCLARCKAVAEFWPWLSHCGSDELGKSQQVHRSPPRVNALAFYGLLMSR